MKRILTLFLVISITSCSKELGNRKEILEVLGNQENKWNNGNIDEFMKGYWQSDSLMFISKNGIKYGWETTLNNYKASYPDKTAMGKLTFNVIKLEINGPTAYMLGKWSIIRESDNPNGHFVLYWKKINGKWLITIDHTS